MPQHKCKFCRGIRENDGKACLGCGSLLVNCLDRSPQRINRDCPGCTHGGPHKVLETGRMRCVKCGAVFEGSDMSYLDDRPDVNLEKLERLEAERKRRGPRR